MKVSNEVVNAKEKQKINKVKVTNQQDITPKFDFPSILDVQEEFKEWKRKGFLWQKRNLQDDREVGNNISLSYARVEDLTQDAQGSNGYVYIAIQEPSVGFIVRSEGVVEEVQETTVKELHKPFAEE
jgi:hypothetical protein